METNNTAEITSAANRNILLGILKQGITKNALATKAGIPSTTFTRKLDHPEQFTIKELGSIAEALEVPFVELLQDAA